MFRVTTPNQIGSVLGHKLKDTSHNLRSLAPSVGPWLDPTGFYVPDGPFLGISEYFRWLFTRKSLIFTKNQDPADLDEAQAALQVLQEYVLIICQKFDSEHLRPVPVHEDLTAHNILCNKSGEITGVIDWEFHAVKPAVLAVSYPPWTSHFGTPTLSATLQDSRFTSYFLCSPSEGKRLCDYYESVSGA